MKILIVEDEPKTGDYLRQGLREAGFVVELARNGPDGLHMGLEGGCDFLRLSEFSSDLAHELRTPISNLLTQTQVTLGQPREAQVYRDILAFNVEELQRLARMGSDMLFLAKIEHGLELPQREQIALADEV